MTNTHSSLNNAVLTNDALMAKAPSIFAVEPWERMSSKYTFIPTIQIVDKMRAEGFQPVSAMQSRTRIEGKQEFTKHVVRFRDMRNGDSPVARQLGQLYPEIVLTNSHDGASAYKIDAGLFRLVCMNGLMVSDSTVETMNVRHSGSADGIIEASYTIVEDFPKVLDSVESFQRLQLTAPQQQVFASAALELRYDANESPVTADAILRPRRYEDKEPTVWNTFNVVQENLVNGGIRTYDAETRRRGRTRSVNGISESSRLNKALWTLTQEMQKLVSA